MGISTARHWATGSSCAPSKTVTVSPWVGPCAELRVCAVLASTRTAQGGSRCRLVVQGVRMRAWRRRAPRRFLSRVEGASNHRAHSGHSPGKRARQQCADPERGPYSLRPHVRRLAWPPGRGAAGGSSAGAYREGTGSPWEPEPPAFPHRLARRAFQAHTNTRLLLRLERTLTVPALRSPEARSFSYSFKFRLD